MQSHAIDNNVPHPAACQRLRHRIERIPRHEQQSVQSSTVEVQRSDTAGLVALAVLFFQTNIRKKGALHKIRLDVMRAEQLPFNLKVPILAVRLIPVPRFV